MQHVRLGTLEREIKGRKTRRSFSLSILNYQITIKQRFREFNKLFSDIKVYWVTRRNNRDMLHESKTPLRLKSYLKTYKYNGKFTIYGGC